MANFSISYLIELRDKYSSVAERIKVTNQRLRDSFSGMKNKLNDFGKKLEQTNKSLKNWGDSAKKMGERGLLWLTAPIAAAGAAAIKFASDMEETMNKTNVVFKGESNSVVEWSKNAIYSIGLAQQSALEMASLFGDMATGMGINEKRAASMSMVLTQLAGDLASFKNISFGAAQTALSGVFTGETESLKKMGVIMTQHELSQFAMSKGLESNILKYTQAQKVALRYAFVLRATRNAMGDKINTMFAFANQLRDLRELLKEFGRQIGDIIMPFALKGLYFLNSFIKNLMTLKTSTLQWIIILSAIAAIIPPILFVVGGLAAAIGAIGVATAGWISVGVALAGVLTTLYIKSESFRAVLGAIFSIIKAMTAGLMVLGRLFGEYLIAKMSPVLEFLDSVLNKFGGITNIANKISGFFNKKASQTFDIAMQKGTLLQAIDVNNKSRIDGNIQVSSDSGSKVTKTELKSTGKNINLNMGATRSLGMVGA